jgi:glycosyltransferase involved in cell wall biosynthesis
VNDELPVSVVVPAFNRADTLGRALESAFGQSPRPPAEVVVVDDGSSDGTAAVAERAGARVVQHAANRGPSAARNTAIESARQAWIAPLDADDEWLPHHLERLWAARAGHVLVAGACLWVDHRGAVVRFEGAVDEVPMVLRSPEALLFPENHVPASAVLLRRDALERAGRYDEHITLAEDLDLWVRMLEHGTGVLLPDVVSIYHLHEEQATADRAALRLAHETLAAKYARRPWASAALVDRVRAVAAWDELREDERAGRRATALRKLAALVARPRRAAALAPLLARRRRVRARTAEMAQSRGDQTSGPQ